MSENTEFDIDNALVELIELAQCGKQAAAIDLANKIEEEHKKTLEHCKQGEQERFKSWMEKTFSPDSDVLKVFSNQKPFLYLRMRNGEPDWSDDCVSPSRGDLLENGLMEDGEYSVLPLFTHAIPKSEEVYELRAKNAYLLAQLKTNSIPPQPPCDNEHVADGCEKFSTPQPSTDVSELEKDAARYRYLMENCLSSDKDGYLQIELEVARESSYHWDKRQYWIGEDIDAAIIAKHTVK